MKRVLIKISIGIGILFILYICFLYFVSYSDGVRAGELIKFSHKGVMFKTWEGEISQGVSESQRFVFSVQDKEKQVIEDLNNFQGKMVKLHYFERYKILFWLGDTEYFVTKVEVEQ
jgi:hypothetical protein